MIHGIIDIGSNTIRLSIYKCVDKEINLLLNKKTMAGLAGYTKNGKLSDGGIKKACEVLSEYRKIVDNFDIKNISVFATASLRNISNSDEAVYRIEQASGFNINILSGVEEGICDFAGAIHQVDFKEGVLVDIGGGSTEIVIFKDKNILKVFSMPIGSLNFYSKYVGKLIPTEDERKEMKKAVIEELDKIQGIKGMYQKNICGVGGSIRATNAINRKIFSKNKNKQADGIIDTKNINKIIKKLDNTNKDTLLIILKVIPDRIHTAIPGMVILNTIVDYFKSEKIYVSNYGVREGYLYSRILDGGENSERQ